MRSYYEVNISIDKAELYEKSCLFNCSLRHGDEKCSHGGESRRGGRRNSKQGRSMEGEQFRDVRERSENSLFLRH